MLAELIEQLVYVVRHVPQVASLDVQADIDRRADVDVRLISVPTVVRRILTRLDRVGGTATCDWSGEVDCESSGMSLVAMRRFIRDWFKPVTGTSSSVSSRFDAASGYWTPTKYWLPLDAVDPKDFLVEQNAGVHCGDEDFITSSCDKPEIGRLGPIDVDDVIRGNLAPA